MMLNLLKKLFTKKPNPPKSLAAYTANDKFLPITGIEIWRKLRGEGPDYIQVVAKDNNFWTVRVPGITMEESLMKEAVIKINYEKVPV